MGHIREIPEKGLNVDVDAGFVPTFVVRDDKEEVVRKIKALASQADEVFLATDPDREGEAIAAHIHDVLDAKSQKKVKRVSYHEITKKAILDALSKPRKIDVNLVSAAKARQVLDRLIGYKVSPTLWFSVGRGTSAGRVQSVALKIICDRQKERDAFKPITYWYVDVLLGCKNGEFWARVVVPKSEENRFLDKKVASDTLEKLKGSKYVLADVQKTTKAVKPFPPFDTNSLQGACSAILKWDITRTMKVAQSLYEQGKITYLRSDSFSIAEEALQEVRQYIQGEHGDKYLPASSNTYAKKASSASQEAHECIRPTHIADDGSELSGDDAKMYGLVRDRFIACQMKPMVVDAVKYTVEADCKETLAASGQSISFDGFSKVWRHKNTKEEVLPSAEKGEMLTHKDSKNTENKTKPPDRYTDASLADKLENDGVGRPATRAPIIKSLEDKGYIVKDKSALVATEIGLSIVDFLIKSFASSFMDIKFTSKMEEEMLKIAEGQAGYLDVVSDFYGKLKEDLKKSGGEKRQDAKTGAKCTECGKGDIVEKVGKFGKFFSCNAYPECKTIFEKDGDKFVLHKKKKVDNAGRDCPECKKPLVVRKSEYGSFVGCSGFPACRYIEKKGFEPGGKK